MAADMLDQLQENKLRGLEELMDSYQAGAALGSGEDQAAAIADFFVDEGIGLRQSSLRLWEYNWTMALEGKILDRRQRGIRLRSLLERGARILSRDAAVARALADLSGCEVARLDQFEEQTKAFPLWVEECAARWELLDRPHKPLDRERIARAQAAFERGECESVSEILARLEKGGPLVRE
jgi:hypothetical protein